MQEPIEDQGQPTDPRLHACFPVVEVNDPTASVGGRLVSISPLSADVGFLDKNYRYKKVATWIPYSCQNPSALGIGPLP